MNEVIALVSFFVALTSVFVSIRRNKFDTTRVQLQDEKQLEARITAVELQLKNMVPINDRVVAIETKIGLFWGIVEEYMTKFVPNANPITFTPVEQVAWNNYKVEKSHADTRTLRTLEAALEREFDRHDKIPADEAFAWAWILTAIKAQLVDRGEVVHKHGHT